MPREVVSLSLEDARQAIAAGERKALELKVPYNIAVVDAGGGLVAHVRMDGAWLGSVDIAIDKAWTARAFDMPTDALARLAQSGRCLTPLLETLLRDPYFRLRPPKSTGREYFGRTFVQKILAEGRKFRARPEDLIHTATILTALSVVDALNRFVLPCTKISQLIVSGGGARNPLLMCQIEAALAPIELLTSEKFAVPEQSKEAYAFALLAYETFHHRPANLPSATGATRPAILGKISYA